MSTAIVWFRRDLRLSDNPALLAALAGAERIIPVYIQMPSDQQNRPMGSASRWWLHHSLESLGEALAASGSRLIIRQGSVPDVLKSLIGETGAEKVFWNRLYEPDDITRDTHIKQMLRAAGIHVETFNSTLLYEPWEVKRPTGEPYRVFTPFWKAVQTLGIHRTPKSAPDALPSIPSLESLTLESLNLRPTIPWDSGFHEHWQPGEPGAWQKLDEFSCAVSDYKSARDIPGQSGTSRLSPHLHFGEISPRQIVARLLEKSRQREGPGTECYIREIGWREFAFHLLFHFPHTADQPLDERFSQLPWRSDYAEDLSLWQRGQTGYPIIDAGMRELWHTGWMHNRVRMIAASLLTKNLLIPWQAGARWFWDTLVDADLASNSLGWQWTAGCGADAAPYFRIFNPVLQGERFDPQGNYVRRWVPELARLPAGLIHKPWEAEDSVLKSHGLNPGQLYPRPMVDLKLSRERALDAFGVIKAGVIRE